MTRFPPRPDLKAPQAIAGQGREVTRAHARLDQVESTQNQQVTQIGAISTGTGGTTAQNFLGLLATAAAGSPQGADSAQATFLADLAQVTKPTQQTTGSWTTGGALAAGTWDATHASALVTFLNECFADIQNILAALHNAGITT